MQKDRVDQVPTLVDRALRDALRKENSDTVII